MVGDPYTNKLLFLIRLCLLFYCTYTYVSVHQVKKAPLLRQIMRK